VVRCTLCREGGGARVGYVTSLSTVSFRCNFTFLLVYSISLGLDLKFHKIIFPLITYTSLHTPTRAHAHTHTHTHTHIYILFKRSKICIIAFKTILHVSITRSSSWSIHCSLQKSRPAHHTTHNHNHAHSKHRTTHTQKHDMLPQQQS